MKCNRYIQQVQCSICQYTAEHYFKLYITAVSAGLSTGHDTSPPHPQTSLLLRRIAPLILAAVPASAHDFAHFCILTLHCLVMLQNVLVKLITMKELKESCYKIHQKVQPTTRPTSSSCRGLWPFMKCWPFLGQLWFSVGNLVTRLFTIHVKC